jgi:hypothetical protein
LFRDRLRFDGPPRFNDEYFVFGEPREAVAAVVHGELRAYLANATPDFDAELDGSWAVFSRRGALWNGEHEGYLAEVQPVVRLLSDG